MKKIHYSLDQLEEVVQSIRPLLADCSIVAFRGPLGAGKTTFIKALLKSFGIDESITSPTFTYLNTYSNPSGKIFYHFDLYRLKTLEEFIDQGFDEYLNEPHAVTLIEWPEVIEPLLQKRACFLDIDYADDRRSITITQR